MSRPDWHTYFMTMALVASSRGTCPRRKVGCVITDNKHRVLATGYNGKPAGAGNCSDRIDLCPGWDAPSGTGLGSCHATHAEVNAKNSLGESSILAHTLYCTASPCRLCMVQLLYVPLKRIVFLEDYPHPESKDMALSRGIEWTKFSNILAMRELVETISR